MWRFAVLLLLLAPPALAAPHRIVSLNPCLDTDVIHLADRDQIAALSHWAHEQESTTIADLAKGLPITYETAEEIILFKPDLVLTSRHSSLATRNALARVGVQTELFDEPRSVDESIAQVRRVAKLVGQEERGEAMAARIEAALAAAAPPPNTPPVTALIFQRNGFSTGAHSLVDEMLTRTGFVNVAARYGLKSWGNVSLEPIVADPPQVLLAGEIAPGMPTWADRVLRHPALAAIGPRMTRAIFPDTLMYCGGPVLIQSAATLAAARDSALGVKQ